jgi:hypothetical protein
MRFVNKSEYDLKELKRLTRLVASRLKKSFKFDMVEVIEVESYNSRKWYGQYDGKNKIKVRIGRKVRWPNSWDRKAPLMTWEDLYVGLLTWCLVLHYQRTCWARRLGTGKKFIRADCQEITLRMLKTWRVAAEINLIMEKVEEDGTLG